MTDISIQTLDIVWDEVTEDHASITTIQTGYPASRVRVTFGNGVTVTLHLSTGARDFAVEADDGTDQPLYAAYGRLARAASHRDIHGDFTHDGLDKRVDVSQLALAAAYNGPDPLGNLVVLGAGGTAQVHTGIPAITHLAFTPEAWDMVKRLDGFTADSQKTLHRALVLAARTAGDPFRPGGTASPTQVDTQVLSVAMAAVRHISL